MWLNLKNINIERPTKKLNWIHAKYIVTKVFENSPHFCELNTPKRIHNRSHTSLLRPVGYTPLPSQKTDDAQPPGLLMGNGELKFGIEKVLDSRIKKIGRG